MYKGLLKVRLPNSGFSQMCGKTAVGRITKVGRKYLEVTGSFRSYGQVYCSDSKNTYFSILVAKKEYAPGEIAETVKVSPY